MYELLDKLLASEMKRIRTSFNRLGSMGFDELTHLVCCVSAN